MVLKFLAVVLLLSYGVSVAIPVNDQIAADELSRLKTSAQLAQLQLQLEKLRQDLLALRSGGSSQKQSVSSSLNDGRASETIVRKLGDQSDPATYQLRRGGKNAEAVVNQQPPTTPDTGIFYDRPVTPSVRLLGEVGWQPLKRAAEPSTDQASFRLAFNDRVDLRQEMVETVANHVLRDLEAARKYGIEPREILQDLRQKHGG